VQRVVSEKRILAVALVASFPTISLTKHIGSLSIESKSCTNKSNILICYLVLSGLNPRTYKLTTGDTALHILTGVSRRNDSEDGDCSWWVDTGADDEPWPLEL
jgi:hypothetical protein